MNTFIVIHIRQGKCWTSLYICECFPGRRVAMLDISLDWMEILQETIVFLRGVFTIKQIGFGENDDDHQHNHRKLESVAIPPSQTRSKTIYVYLYDYPPANFDMILKFLDFLGFHICVRSLEATS